MEICKTLMTDNLKVLILDEPTSALSTDKAGQLHQVVKELSDKGVAVIYISHKLDEIKLVSDRILLMRNGQNAGACDPDEITTQELIGMMGGEMTRRERGEAAAGEGADGKRLVDVKNLTGGQLQDISMHVGRGEIVGISGLVGSGQTELLNAIFSAADTRAAGLRTACSSTAPFPMSAATAPRKACSSSGTFSTTS